MKGMNATVVDVDKSAFKERVKPLYDEFKAKDAQSAKNLELVESMYPNGQVIPAFSWKTYANTHSYS